MNSILRQLQELADADLYALSEAVDMELQRREEIVGDIPDSARRRALEREQSYRRRNGARLRPSALSALARCRRGDTLRDRVLGELLQP